MHHVEEEVVMGRRLLRRRGRSEDESWRRGIKRCRQQRKLARRASLVVRTCFPRAEKRRKQRVQDEKIDQTSLSTDQKGKERRRNCLLTSICSRWRRLKSPCRVGTAERRWKSIQNYLGRLYSV